MHFQQNKSAFIGLKRLRVWNSWIHEKFVRMESKPRYPVSKLKYSRSWGRCSVPSAYLVKTGIFLTSNCIYLPLLSVFIRPSSDGTYYGMVMSVRPALRPSIRPSVRPSQFSALFSYMLWDIELKFCLSLYYDARKSKFECHQFRQFLMELCPFLTSNCYKYAVFRTFLLHALTFRAEIWHMTLFYCTTEQVWVSSISVNFCWSYAPFGT